MSWEIYNVRRMRTNTFQRDLTYINSATIRIHILFIYFINILCAREYLYKEITHQNVNVCGYAECIVCVFYFIYNVWENKKKWILYISKLRHIIFAFVYYYYLIVVSRYTLIILNYYLWGKCQNSIPKCQCFICLGK